MAKTTVTRRESEPAVEVKLSAVTVRLIDKIRPAFNSFVSDFGALAIKRRELAPAFMKAFNRWQSETEGSFPDFVRVLVPDLPTDSEGYRHDPRFNAAQYLRQLSIGSLRETASAGTTRRVSATPLAVLASLLAAVLPILDDESTVWTAISESSQWGERQVTALQEAVAEAEPLFKAKTPRGMGLIKVAA